MKTTNTKKIYNNLNKSILSMIQKGDRIIYKQTQENYFISDSYCVWIIPTTELYINIEKYENAKNIKMQHFFNNENYSKEVEDTQTQIKQDKLYLNIFTYNNKNIYIDSKKLKTYGDNIYLATSEEQKPEKSPLFVYNLDDHALLGLILPVRKHEG